MPRKKTAATKSSNARSQIIKAKEPTRFAHPFYTTVPKSKRKAIPGVGKGLAQYPSTARLLEPIPTPQREPTMVLEEIVGSASAKQIEKSGSISFHSLGDTGNPDAMTETVSTAMATDFDIAHPESCPAFLLHLGDVIYYDNTDKGYLSQFYVPYKKYPGKIIAIPGNHDGEMFKYDEPGQPSTGQSVTLEAFQKNFCQPQTGVPASAGTIFREMISQPGVYWHLNAPFVDIVALYSNVADGPGFISDNHTIGSSQKDWLVKTLTNIASLRKKGQRKALIITVHHPPFSGGGHSPSVDMLKDIDDACKTASIMPDAVLSGHSHNYQRFTRYTTFNGTDMQIPYYVVGCGGHGMQNIPNADGARIGDHTFDSSLKGYGYLITTVDKSKIVFKFYQVNADASKQLFDKIVVVDLKSNQIVPG